MTPYTIAKKQPKPSFVALPERIQNALDNHPETALRLVYLGVRSGIFREVEQSIKNPDAKEFEADKLFPRDWDLRIFTAREISQMTAKQYIECCTGYVSILKGYTNPELVRENERYTLFVNATGRGVSPLGVWAATEQCAEAVKDMVLRAWQLYKATMVQAAAQKGGKPHNDR